MAALIRMTMKSSVIVRYIYYKLQMNVTETSPCLRSAQSGIQSPSPSATSCSLSTGESLQMFKYLPGVVGSLNFEVN